MRVILNHEKDCIAFGCFSVTFLPTSIILDKQGFESGWYFREP